MTAERHFPWIAAMALLATLALSPPAGAEGPDAAVEEFFGDYVGEAIIEYPKQFRDIIVRIGPIRNGFSIYTSTVIRTGSKRAASDVKWRAETQSFVQTDMPHVYEPMVRKSMFSEKRDPDLMAGDTLAWASVRGRTLGVYAMNVLPDGHYELRVFERTLTDLGMDLGFVRYNDGVPVRRLKGTLARTKPDVDEN